MTLYVLIFLGALLILGYIVYLGRIAQKDPVESKQPVNDWEEEQERKKITQLRQEKRRQEKARLEGEKLRQQVLDEIQPLLANFINAYFTTAIIENIGFIQEILEGRTISMHELLQHNVNRTFADGKPYRVGLAREINGKLISLQPEELEQLQLYFINLVDFLSTIKSKGFAIDALTLQQMLFAEFKNQSSDISVQAL